jgi:hypothetical protein
VYKITVHISKLGPREHLFVSLKINYIFGYGDLQIYESGAKNRRKKHLKNLKWLFILFSARILYSFRHTGEQDGREGDSRARCDLD